MATVLNAPARREGHWIEVIERLGPEFAGRAAEADERDGFVAENYDRLREHRVFSAGTPEELGGGGASHAELCGMLRRLAHHCPSTALALSMHTHLVATTVHRWRHGAPVEPFLRRVAAEELVLATSGGSDFLDSSGRAERADGGYVVNARKIFASGAPAGRLFLTSAILDDPEAGPTVLHFPLSFDSPGVRLLDTWRVLGMRGTGSHDVLLENVFVPEAAVGERRARGAWSATIHAVVLNAAPLVYAVYVGIAEAARDLAVREATRKRDNPDVQLAVGEMENDLQVARLALADMVDAAAHTEPGVETTNRVAMDRTLAGRAAIRTVEKAMEVAGGGSFYRRLGLERLFRDVQAARFHPLQEKPQLRYSGRLALGLDATQA